MGSFAIQIHSSRTIPSRQRKSLSLPTFYVTIPLLHSNQTRIRECAEASNLMIKRRLVTKTKMTRNARKRNLECSVACLREGTAKLRPQMTMTTKKRSRRNLSDQVLQPVPWAIMAETGLNQQSLCRELPASFRKRLLESNRALLQDMKMEDPLHDKKLQLLNRRQQLNKRFNRMANSNSSINNLSNGPSHDLPRRRVHGYDLQRCSGHSPTNKIDQYRRDLNPTSPLSRSPAVHQNPHQTLPFTHQRIKPSTNTHPPKPQHTPPTQARNQPVSLTLLTQRSRAVNLTITMMTPSRISTHYPMTKTSIHPNQLAHLPQQSPPHSPKTPLSKMTEARSNPYHHPLVSSLPGTTAGCEHTWTMAVISAIS
ncbi:hypothetical protein H113_02625 [Trichophyton rubrum MR1459]|uniref:Uncharacterized protein n=1 Tax=Trichophyton soudanense CBS 452.61 TaxID=1215331 RepID=A0A022XZF2_TRISD|nr:hypothetical protein H100_02616 [Trichophyton rubrum MR850]EZF65215.1 hypothetical protein H104_02598 [Trichophyton rubrum CBS 289.86]EZF75914.1 hypothetical protein H105_02624 [Trichophyton soudanense CBS 452.61]EZF86536.1 hypothetical protein H110_02615 [Trichophyton rubrum MR1448]EZF97302.1 hypothetical protein H113_02625 [Trichophyton rubrum MR1459]EZG08294.1 hypothetical protein H106_02477 [Trichophyton rubrum CBS 735.88]EZG18844.1 hypothetical protein H107_02694 [Trichophyton rubrum 